MDFAYDARTEELRTRLLAFMDEHVYPAEAVAEEQRALLTSPGTPRRSSRSSRPRPSGRACGTSSSPTRSTGPD